MGRHKVDDQATSAFVGNVIEHATQGLAAATADATSVGGMGKIYIGR